MMTTLSRRAPMVLAARSRPEIAESDPFVAAVVPWLNLIVPASRLFRRWRRSPKVRS